MAATRQQYSLQLNTESDADVIAYLESRENKNDTIRQALRMMMEEEAYRQRSIEAHESGDRS